MLTNRITKVRLFYTQHVLPLIYDYSLSFYEALCKIADTLNDTIEAVEELDKCIRELYELSFQKDVLLKV